MASISWMNEESDQYKKLNQLALESGTKNDQTEKSEKVIKDGDGKLRTVPELALANCDAKPNIFFQKDVQKTKQEVREALAKMKDTIGPNNQVIKANTRLPSSF